MIRGTFVIKIYVLKDMRQSTNLFRVSFNIVFMPHKSFCTILLQVTTFLCSKVWVEKKIDLMVSIFDTRSSELKKNCRYL